MMIRYLLTAMLAIGAAMPAGAVVTDPAIGTWRNPRGTLAVTTAPCAGDGGGLCGAISWASPQAMADARDAGIATLVGTQLLQDYHRSGGHDWAGRVYVPDMGHSFSSRIRQPTRDELVISGCLVGGFLCKSQVWHRA